MSRLKKFADHADHRVADLQDQLKWYEMMGFRLRTRRGNGPMVDETEKHVGMIRRALQKWQTIRAGLRRDHNV